MVLLQAVSAILVITLIVANCWTVQNMANTVLEILVAFNDVVILSLNWKMTKLTLARKRYLINHFSDISDAKRKKEMLANLGEKYKIQAKSNESLTNLAKSTESDTSGLSSKNIYMMSKKKNFIAYRNEKLKQTKSLKLKLYCAFGLSTILSAVGCAFFLLELTFFLTGSIEYFSIFSSISIFQAMLLLFLSDSFVDGVEINTAELSIKSDKKPATMLNSVTVLENRNLQSSNQTIEQEISVGMQRENKEHALKQNPKPLRIQISNSNKEFRGTVSEEIRRY
ncbi:hypothetical protein HDU92_007705 [Lobulomyces angularis]|nr:hypothetical protein HDU92_007705 [Lobulomyces angularis]